MLHYSFPAEIDGKTTANLSYMVAGHELAVNPPI
jgi:hypothetical protein